jgi:hypothetical protein
MKALADFAKVMGGSNQALGGLVDRSFLEERALARGALEILSGKIIDLNSPVVRLELERQYAIELSDRFGILHLDMSTMRSPSRGHTQFLARVLYQKGAAGVLYKSNWDDELCVALFGKRARLRAIPGEPARPLTDQIPELLSVLVEYGLQVTTS